MLLLKTISLLLELIGKVDLCYSSTRPETKNLIEKQTAMSFIPPSLLCNSNN